MWKISPMANNIFLNPLSKPIYLMAKPIGPICNLKCNYCYYLEKENIYQQLSNFQMSDEVLEQFTKSYIGSQPTTHILFTWHGGEPMLRNIDFYQKALHYQKKYARGKKIYNALQTNGTLINDEWCSFFKDHNFLIGISIDGPEHCHDHYRKHKNGAGSFKEVIKAIEKLHQHSIAFNTMSVINDYNIHYPIDIYRFFKEVKSQYMQFTPIVERVSNERNDWLTLLPPEQPITAQLSPQTVQPIDFGNFYIEIFKEWVKKDVGKYFVQLFDATLANYMNVLPGVCIFAPTCGNSAVMEFNGDIYSCDHFVFPEFKLGNIKQNSFIEIMMNPQQVLFGEHKKSKLPTQCKECNYLHLCNGECPKNRIDIDQYGMEGLNYLCKGYYNFFHFSEPYFLFMANELHNKRAPANVMHWEPSERI